MAYRIKDCVEVAAEHRRWVELLTCALCGQLITFERFDARLPPEGEQCAACDSWVCPDCLDYSRDLCCHCAPPPPVDNEC